MSPAERVGSARYCWPTSTKGRSGMRPRRDRPFGLGDLLEGAAEVHGAGAAAVRVRPRHVALDGEVELERAGAVAVPAVGAGDATGQPVAEEIGDRTGREVEQDDVGGRDVGGGADHRAGVDLAAELVEQQRPARR